MNDSPNTGPDFRTTALRWLPLLLLLLVGFIADWASKNWALQTLRNEPLTVIPGMLEFRYAENRAIAFSMFHDLSEGVRKPLIFTMTGGALLFLLGLIWSARKRSIWQLLPFILILAGAVGNLQDRLKHGFVIDFVRVHWRDSWSFAIFNVADALITVGTVLLLAAALFAGPKPDSGKIQPA